MISVCGLDAADWPHVESGKPSRDEWLRRPTDRPSGRRLKNGVIIYLSHVSEKDRHLELPFYLVLSVTGNCH